MVAGYKCLHSLPLPTIGLVRVAVAVSVAWRETHYTGFQGGLQHALSSPNLCGQACLGDVRLLLTLCNLGGLSRLGGLSSLESVCGGRGLRGSGSGGGSGGGGSGLGGFRCSIYTMNTSRWLSGRVHTGYIR